MTKKIKLSCEGEKIARHIEVDTGGGEVDLRHYIDGEFDCQYFLGEADCEALAEALLKAAAEIRKAVR